MNTDTLPIYQNGLTLTPQEEQLLTNKAWSQSKQIAKILKNRPGQGYTTQEMKACLENLFGKKTVNEHSVKRAMSTMTGTKGAPDKLKDKYGRYPLIKLDEKRLNPESGVKIHVYAWNPRYNQPQTHREIVEEQKRTGQYDFYGQLGLRDGEATDASR